jgi:hypothetical protein
MSDAGALMHAELGEVRSYADLHAVLRQRAAKLEVTLAGLDQVSGLQDGYSAKLLAPAPIKKLGPISWGLLAALGMKLIAVEDEEAVRKFGAQVAAYRRTRPPRPSAPKITPEILAVVERRQRMMQRRRGRLGAQARIAAQSPKQRSEHARRAARARWARLSPDQRRKATSAAAAALRKKREKLRAARGR